MPRFLQELLGQVRGIWGRLDGGQRLTIVSVVMAAFVGLGAIVWFAGRPDYEAVFSAEDPAALDEAVRALGSAGIGYREEGSRLLVERSNSGRAMQALMRAGVSGDKDPERDEGVVSVTQDTMTRQDALMVKRNRRAQKAVEQISGVVGAYVTSSTPKRSAFEALDADTKPSASVTLTLRQGEPFVTVARAAIRQVAATCGIPEANVTAVDARTKQTFSLDENGNEIAGGEFLDQQRRRSLELTRRAQQWLDRLYEGRAIVTVSVDLDPLFTTSEQKIQPETPAIVSDDKTEDVSASAAPSVAAGDPSITSSPAAADASGPSQKRKTTKRVYEPFSGTKRSGMLTPDIRRMSIALVLDESIEKGKIASIEEAIKSTVGFLGPRQSGLADEFKTLTEKFPELALPEAAVSESDAIALAREFGPLGAQVLGVVVVVLFLRHLLKSSAPKVRPQPAAATAAASADAANASPESLPPDERRRRMRRDIEKSINEDPSAISRMLETWLAEQKS